MQQRQVVLRFLVPANQETAKTVHPRMRPFHHPAPRFAARFVPDRFRLFPTRAYMGGEAKLLHHRIDRIIVVARIQAPTLRLLLGWLWSADAAALDGSAHPFP